MNHKQTYVFRSNLTVKDCATKIEKALSKKTAWQFLFGRDKRDVVGKVTEDKFSIYARTRFGDNPFYPIFEANLIEAGKATTQIEGSFHMHQFIKWFLIIWISLSGLAVVTLGVIFMVSTLQHDPQQAKDALFWLPFAVVMLIAQPFAYVWRISMIKSDKRAILKFIQDVCEATSCDTLLISSPS